MTPPMTIGVEDLGRRQVPPRLSSKKAMSGVAMTSSTVFKDGLVVRRRRRRPGLKVNCLGAALGRVTCPVRPSAFASRSVCSTGDEVDDVEVDGLVLVDGDGVAHGLLGPVGVAAAQLGDAADVGDGVVRDLAAERALDVVAVGIDRRGGADGRVGRHRGDIARPS